jgi:putative glutamine amidotransferase
MDKVPRVAVPRWLPDPGSAPTASQQNYLDCIREAGLEAVDLTDASATLSGCSGLLLTGGVDIDPALYGEQPHPRTEEVNRARDEIELRLLREAFASGLPVLAVCRGHQLLNVCLGGSLLQHVESGAHVSHEAVTSSFHEIKIDAGSKLRGIYETERLLVNSRHHQAVTPEGLAQGLKCTAVSDDGLVEGVESPAHGWVVGVQWHPERPEPEKEGFADSSRKLWEAFASAVRGH